MMLAHIAGLPFEEWLGPLLATGGSAAVGVRAAFRRLRQRH
ncbi:MAG TPA: hypothetical protein VN636_02495 [Acidimicrobiia bacterium]|nr:hypothetical protein [Acidimicrobiia bacterium]